MISCQICGGPINCALQRASGNCVCDVDLTEQAIVFHPQKNIPMGCICEHCSSLTEDQPGDDKRIEPIEA